MDQMEGKMIELGKLTVLLGKNGSGKSEALLKIVRRLKQEHHNIYSGIKETDDIRANDFLLFIGAGDRLDVDNQRLLARNVALAMNTGLNVLITTTSHFVVKELSNLIMLSNNIDNKQSIMGKAGLSCMHVIQPSDVRAYYYEKGATSEVEVNRLGIRVGQMDEEIDSINELSDDIYYSIKG